MTRQLSYGEDVQWGEDDLKPFLIYNRMCGDQARAISAWNVAKMRGEKVGPRPETVPAQVLADRARAQAETV